MTGAGPSVVIAGGGVGDLGDFVDLRLRAARTFGAGVVAGRFRTMGEGRIGQPNFCRHRRNASTLMWSAFATWATGAPLSYSARALDCEMGIEGSPSPIIGDCRAGARRLFPRTLVEHAPLLQNQRHGVKE
jgi:hypothetical protein